MLNLREIHKPKTIEQALALVQQPGTVVMAGGTGLLADQRKDVRAVVDLSELSLSYIREQEGTIAIGATTTLAELAGSPIVGAAANGVVAQVAHRSGTSLLRNQATVVGTLIAEPVGILATVLLALDATIEAFTWASSVKREELAYFLAHRAESLKNAIVTQVVIPVAALKRRAAVETVARTPSDKPIVTVCATRADTPPREVTIALGGVDEFAVRATDAERRMTHERWNEELIADAAQEAAKGIDPPSDFRGSAEYRREMVRVLTARVLSSLVS